MSLAGRSPRVRERFEGIDALVVTVLHNVRWLTGFSGSNAVVVLDSEGLTLVTDGRYGEQARQQMAAAGVEGEVLVGATRAEAEVLVAAVANRSAVVGFEADHLTVAQHERYSNLITSALQPTSGIVEAERRTKDQHELDAIERACSIADRALAEVAPRLGGGLTEAQVRTLLETRMRELGASGPSYDTIVAAGPHNGAFPHHATDHTLIEPGHLVVIDVGALVDGYHSDMTRTFVVGEPSAQQLEMYQVVLAAQTAGVAAVAPGVTARQLDAVCRDIIDQAGYGHWFSHGTGHGVGLVIHEDPFINRAGEATLQVGDVVTVEPGVYHVGFGGIRVEDLVVVTSDGCRVLTAFPKDSPCLPSPPTT